MSCGCDISSAGDVRYMCEAHQAAVRTSHDVRGQTQVLKKILRELVLTRSPNAEQCLVCFDYCDTVRSVKHEYPHWASKACYDCVPRAQS